MSNKVTCRDFKQYPKSVFVTPTSIPDSATVQMNAKDWTGIAKDIVLETPLTPPTPKPTETREYKPVRRQTPSEMLGALRARQAKRAQEGYKQVQRRKAQNSTQ